MQLLRRYRLEAWWFVFAAVNVAVLLSVNTWATVPFHFIWVSLTLIYWLRPWPVRATIVVAAAVSLVTGAGLGWLILRGVEEPEELTELPLMALMFAVMVWFARERQEALEELRRSSSREREFVRDASHLLRTPITIARGHTELIQVAHEGEEAGHDARIVLDELERLAIISDRLLLLANFEHPSFLAVEQIDLGRFLRSAGERWSCTANRDWRLEIGSEGTLRGDAERLALALDSLIENAVKATEEGDRIVIAGRAEGRTAVIEIADSGHGIAGEDQERIFERFTRGSVGSRRNGGGTGLGLAIVRAIVEAHHGSVSVDSEPGRGATFRLRLNGFEAGARVDEDALVGAPNVA